MDASRIPVIVGVGQVNDRPADPARGLDPLGLMEAALRAADADAGGGWLERVDSLAHIGQISFPKLTDILGPLAQRLDASPRLSYATHPTGDSPILLLNEAANRIGAGEIEVAAIVGGEALRTASQLRAQAAGGSVSDQNVVAAATAAFRQTYLGRYGLVMPTEAYPLFENALRAADGQTLAQSQRESAEIWSLFSRVAAENEGAWLRRPLSPEDILRTGADNRPLSFPYNKLMVANSSVNQGAGFIVTSLAKARAAGVADERLIFVGRGAAAHEQYDVLARDVYHRSAGMTVSLQRALQLNDLCTDDLDHVEFYSCFPCVPKLARRVTDWPVDKPASVFGGLTFGGGPIGNYMSHAVVSMVLALRKSGRHGLLFANGGLATHNHTIVVSREPLPGAQFPQDFDFQAEADAARGPVPPRAENYVGPGTIETYTVHYDRQGEPRSGVIVARGKQGERFLAKVRGDDAAAIEFLTSGAAEPVGAMGHAEVGSDGDVNWRL
ncbi:MAG: acetyl-CoA acetyltransferase [Steroidobacteraceae bacterium]